MTPDPTPKDHTEAEELLPCPWCNREASYLTEGSGVIVTCISNTEECIVCPQTVSFISKECAAKAWNTRSNPIVERLTAEIKRLTDKNLEWLDAWNKQDEEIAHQKQVIKAAYKIIEHIGWTSSESVEVIHKANKWIKDYQSPPNPVEPV